MDAAIGQFSGTAPLTTREGFRPGARVEASAGWSHAFSQALGSVVQVNVLHRAHDTGPQAEPLNSGSTIVNVSPGMTLAVGGYSTLYAYVQLPVYRKVTGI